MSVPYPDFVNGTTADADQVDANNADIVAEITNSIAADGQTTPTANLPMGGFKHTGLGAGSAATDGVSLGQVQAQAWKWCGTAGGTADALTLSPSPAITAYAAGQSFRFIAGASPNTGAATVAVSGLSAKAIQNNGSALAAADIAAGKMYEIIYDGTQFQATRLSFNHQGYLVASNNLSDLGSASTARTNLGLGALAVESTVTPSLATPQLNAQTGTSYTAALTDNLKLITMTNASANTLTVPTNSSVAFPVGSRFDVAMLGAGVTTVQGDTGVTINGVSAGSLVLAQYGGASLTKTGTDTWLLIGGTVA